MTADPEETMRELVDSLDLSSPDTFNVSLLDDMELVSRFQATTLTLMRMGEAMHPRTQRGRDLLSERSACLVELYRRGLR